MSTRSSSSSCACGETVSTRRNPLLAFEKVGCFQHEAQRVETMITPGRRSLAPGVLVPGEAVVEEEADLACDADGVPLCE